MSLPINDIQTIVAYFKVPGSVKIRDAVKSLYNLIDWGIATYEALGPVFVVKELKSVDEMVSALESLTSEEYNVKAVPSWLIDVAVQLLMTVLTHLQGPSA